MSDKGSSCAGRRGSVEPEAGQHLEQSLSRQAQFARGARASASGAGQCHLDKPSLELEPRIGQSSGRDDRRAGHYLR